MTSTYPGGNILTRGSSASNSGMPTSQPAAPSHSYMESSNSHMSTAHSYSSAEVPDNRAPYVTANSSAFPQENRRGSDAPMSPRSQHGPNSFSHDTAGGSNVSRPYSQYGATVPDTGEGHII